MREIKFRIWDKANEIIIQDDGHFYITADGDVIGVNDDLDISESVILMQYTGLHDKNGKEIYEGDIVTAWSQGYCSRFQIKWRQESAPMWILYPAWQNREFWHLQGSQQPDGSYQDLVEVIGNIYEHAHLLKEVANEQRD